MPKEQRRSPRFDCEGPAEVQIAPGFAPFPARIANVSAGGCLIVLQRPQPILQDTIVELAFTVDDLPFRVWGRVRAIRSQTQIGFQFPLLNTRVQKRLEDLLEQLIEDFVTGTLPHGPGERRRFPRIECRGAAGIQLRAGEPFIPATIVDLSAGGCHMVLHEPQRLPKDALVELKFQVNQLPFRMQGQAKALRSDTRIGFSFALLNQRVRVQIEDVLEELIRNVVKRLSKTTEPA